MSKLIILRGLPASGKSTKAKELLAEGNTIRLNRDLLRKMLHNGKWSPHNEEMTIHAEKALARAFLKDTPHRVIVDDTNLGDKHVDMWKALARECGFEAKVVDMDTPMDVCLERNEVREDKVPREVIINFARQFGRYPRTRPDVIVDMDGTLADIEHRRHFVREVPKNWDGFFGAMGEDQPRMEVVEKVRELAKDHNIVVVSARPDRDSYRQTTLDWLKKYEVPFETLIMRRGGDGRPDEEVKQDLLNAYFDKTQIKLVIDDRPKVIRMWRSHGLEVMDVGTGEEF